MKKMFAIICVIVNSILTTFPQSYPKYHQLKVDAEQKICEHEYWQALEQYKKAFSEVEFLFTKDLYNASICAALSSDTIALFQFMRQCLLQGVPFKEFHKNVTVFGQFQNLSGWKDLENQSEQFLNQYESRINLTYRHILDSLNVEDQKVRNNNEYFLLHRPESKKAKDQRAKMRAVDSCNYLVIQEAMKKYGYPSERNLGIGHGTGYYFWEPICVWHICEMSLIDEVVKAYLNGEMDVERYVAKLEYASIQDFHYIYSKHAKNDDSFSEEIDALRLEVGFPTSEQMQKIKKYLSETQNKYGFIFNYAF